MRARRRHDHAPRPRHESHGSKRGREHRFAVVVWLTSMPPTVGIVALAILLQGRSSIYVREP
jgi:hypothetical protein